MTKTPAILTALIALGTLSSPSDAEACRCMQPNIRNSFANNDIVVIGQIGRTMVTRTERIYTLQVRHSFKGCAEPRQTILIKTPISSATCGAQFRLGQKYLIMGNQIENTGSITTITTNSCTLNKLTRRISRSEKRYLGHMRQECNSCTSDSDCEENSWCRPTESNRQNECTPYAEEGDRCGGFTVPWEYERCDPELTCDTPANIPDAPGVCRSSCRSNRDCASNEYCATDGLCREDASCIIDADCGMNGNNYTRIMCVGYPTCTGGSGFGGGQCGWSCGDPRCEDVGGLDFGLCDMVLGWKRVNGVCEEVSGCSNQGYQFFSTQRECARTCDARVRPSTSRQTRRP